MFTRMVSTSVFALIVVIGLAAPVQATDLSGTWAGSWQSCTTGHSGVLRATFTKCSETKYRVEFTGRICKLLPFRYSVTLNVVEDTGECVTLAGSSYLGRLFGTFRYAASADECSFTAHYSSKKDQGTFVLRRMGS